MENQGLVSNVAKIMNKIHKQFGDPTFLQMKAGGKLWEEDYQDILDNICGSCEICPKFSKTSSKPVVSLSLAKSFGEVIAMHVKESKRGIDILYLIDVFGTFTVARWIRIKSPQSSLRMC